MQKTKLSVLLGALLVITCVAVASQDEKETFTPTGTISGQYDRFEQKTTISLDNMRLETPPGPALVLFLRGEFSGSPKPPANIGLSVVSLSLTGYERPAACALNVILDGDHLNYSLNRYKEAMYLFAFYGQAFRIDIPYPDFRRIARSRTVEVRFCNTEVKLSAAQLSQFNEFRKRFWDEYK